MESVDAIRSKRQLELIEKKKKLELLRKRKANTKIAAVSAFASGVKSPTEKKENIQDFIQNILETPKKENHVEAESPAIVSPKILFKPVLSTVLHVASVNEPPKVLESYARSTQTEVVEEEPCLECANRSSEGQDLNTIVEVQQDEKKVEECRKQMASEEEQSCAFKSDGFKVFMAKTGRIMERALQGKSDFDFMIDYGQLGKSEEEQDTQDAVKEKIKIMDLRWCDHRAVNDMDISPVHAELFVVAYSSRKQNEEFGNDWDVENATDPDGLVIVWSMISTKRPEYVFTCSSQVLQVIFHPFEKHLLIGATYSGQIVLWDMRASSTPVHYTGVSAKGHTHPVYCLRVQGSKNAHTLITASTDGRVCEWNLHKLDVPTKMQQLKVSIPSTTNIASTSITGRDRKHDIALTSVAFVKQDSFAATFGTERGELYSIELHDSKGSSQELEERTLASTYGKHHAPITSLEFNKFYDSHEDTLLLTSSIDWSCSLWNSKTPSCPVFTFAHADDYIYDVKWSTIHASLFAAVDGAGKLSLWDIQQDNEVPIVSTSISQHALSRVRWFPDGHHLLLGDSCGQIFVYSIHSKIATPSKDAKRALDRKVAIAAP